MTIQLIKMLVPEEESAQNDISDLDDMIFDHKLEQEQDLDEEAVLSTRGENVVPSDLLWSYGTT